MKEFRLNEKINEDVVIIDFLLKNGLDIDYVEYLVYTWNEKEKIINKLIMNKNHYSGNTEISHYSISEEDYVEEINFETQHRFQLSWKEFGYEERKRSILLALDNNYHTL